MNIDKTSKYTRIHCTEKRIQDFIIKLDSEIKKFEKEHLIITFSEEINSSTRDYLLFLDIASKKRLQKTSFVIVQKIDNSDDFPENFNIAPTLTEAEDIVDMESMERELGF